LVSEFIFSSELYHCCSHTNKQGTNTAYT